MPPIFLIDFSIAPITSVRVRKVPAPMPYAQPHTRNINVMRVIRPFMNGELPISSPVVGLRRGPHEGSVSRQKTTISPSIPKPAKRKPRDSWSPSMAPWSVVVPSEAFSGL